MEKAIKWAPIAVVAILNFLLFTGTSKFGLALEVDSANYFSAAQSLTLGNGFLQFDEFRYLNAPPLYPLVLSLGYFFGFPIHGFALFLQFLWFNGSLYFLYCILSKRLKTDNVPMYLFLAGGFYFNFLHVFLFALSEAGFVFLLLAWVNQFLKNEKKNDFTLAILFALLCMQRYAVWLVFPGILAIWFKQSRRVIWMLWQLLPALALSAIWWYRNYLLSGSALGEHSIESKLSLQAFWINILRLISGVFEHFNLFTPIMLFIAILAMGSALYNRTKGIQRDFVFLTLAMGFCYFFLLLLQENISFVQMPRYLSVMWPLLLLVPVIFLEGFSWPKWIKITLILLFLAPQTVLLVHHLKIKEQVGAGGFHSINWQYYTRQEIGTNIPDGRLVSNYPDMVWWITNKHCEYSPFKDENKVDYYNRVKEGKVLIWFSENERKHVMNMEFRRRLKNFRPNFTINGCEIGLLE